MSKHRRIHQELSEFLQQKRESISPESVGLPSGKRRRTPGLRREEVAALSGVGLTWYTWFEQGRDIRVSTEFLDRLAHVFALNDDERAHLYVLAHQRAPVETGKTVHHVPDNIQRLMTDLPKSYIAYVLNLHWDVLDYNERAGRYFNFKAYDIYHRNFIGLLFTMPIFKERIANWETTAYQLLSSFRHDYIRAKEDQFMKGMIKNC